MIILAFKIEQDDEGRVFVFDKSLKENPTESEERINAAFLEGIRCASILEAKRIAEKTGKKTMVSDECKKVLHLSMGEDPQIFRSMNLNELDGTQNLPGE